MNHQAPIHRRRNTISEPVYYKFINHYIVIIKVLFDGDKNVNQIFKLVKENEDRKIPYQSVKPVTIDVINDLLKFHLVEEKITKPDQKPKRKYLRKKKPKKQKRIIGLTLLGSELSNLIYFVDDYKRNYLHLKEKINYHFNINDDNKTGTTIAVSRNRYRQRGWKDEDLDNHSRLIEGILFLETHLPLVFLNTLLSRYLKIIFKHALNDISKEILNKVIMNTITENLLDRLEGILADKIFANTSERNNAFNLTYRLLSDWTTMHFLNHMNTFSKNRFIKKESLDLINTLYNILNPPEGFLRNALQREAESRPEINQLIKDLEATGKNKL
jgi:hypothetical protein